MSPDTICEVISDGSTLIETPDLGPDDTISLVL